VVWSNGSGSATITPVIGHPHSYAATAARARSSGVAAPEDLFNALALGRPGDVAADHERGETVAVVKGRRQDEPARIARQFDVVERHGLDGRLASRRIVTGKEQGPARR